MTRTVSSVSPFSVWKADFSSFLNSKRASVSVSFNSSCCELIVSCYGFSCLRVSRDWIRLRGLERVLADPVVPLVLELLGEFRTAAFDDLAV